jgi:hypothetical protein
MTCGHYRAVELWHKKHWDRCISTINSQQQKPNKQTMSNYASSSSTSSAFQYKDDLTEYVGTPITLFRRKDCDPFGGTPSFMRQMLRNIPNRHPKFPDIKQRTPNVAVDNLCLFKDRAGRLCTIVGLFDKTVPINGVDTKFKGWTLSGGHVEVRILVIFYVN